MLNEAQLEAHYRGIGGSTIATVLGLNPYQTPHDLWECILFPEKRPDLSNHLPVLLGNEMEDAIARIYAKRNNIRVRKSHKTYYHPKYNYILCHPDRFVVGDSILLEIKNRKDFMRGKYGDNGTESVLDSDYCQVQWNTALTQSKMGKLIASFGNSEICEYPIKHNKEFVEFIFHKAHEFWQEFVICEKEPPPMNYEDVKKIFPTTAGKPIILTPDYEQMCYQYEKIAREINEKESLKKTIRDEIAVFCKDSDILLDVTGKPVATFKSDKAGKRVLRINNKQNQLAA